MVVVLVTEIVSPGVRRVLLSSGFKNGIDKDYSLGCMIVICDTVPEKKDAS